MAHIYDRSSGKIYGLTKEQQWARRECRILRERERAAIIREDWAYYWLLRNDRMNIVRQFFPHLFFGSK